MEVEYVTEQRRRGRNPYELRDLELLWRDHGFTMTDLRSEMTDAITDRSVGTIQVILIFLGTRGSIPPVFVPLLCELLEFRHAEISNEDIIEILGETRDERAIPHLVSVIWDDRFPGIDENYWAAKKAVLALGEIGGESSFAALTDAMGHSSLEIREECKQLLRT